MSNYRKAFLTGFTLSTIGFATYLLADKRARTKIKHLFESESSISYKKHNQELQTNLGNPNPRDERDNNMVSEGSMYSVKYYNEEKER
jgi:hypothetical protein